MLHQFPMHGDTDLPEGFGIRIVEGDLLHLLGPLSGLFHRAAPVFPLHGVDQPEARFKDGNLLLRQPLQKCQIAQHDVRDHLMHIIGVVLAHVAMAVGGQSQFVVLRSVDDLGLQGGIDLAKSHRRGRATQQREHLHVGGRLLHPDL